MFGILDSVLLLLEGISAMQLVDVGTEREKLLLAQNRAKLLLCCSLFLPLGNFRGSASSTISPFLCLSSDSDSSFKRNKLENKFSVPEIPFHHNLSEIISISFVLFPVKKGVCLASGCRNL